MIGVPTVHVALVDHPPPARRKRSQSLSPAKTALTIANASLRLTTVGVGVPLAPAVARALLQAAAVMPRQSKRTVVQLI